MTPTVGVLGGGTWGLALALAARRAGGNVMLHSRRHKDGQGGISATTDLAVLAQARLIIVAVPSHTVRTIARELGDHLSGAHMLVHGIRGLSGDNLLTVSQLLREETPARRVGALGGPVQAAELASGRPSAIVVGSAFVDVREAVVNAFEGTWLQVHETADLRGLEWAAALVGCLSIGIGYAQARSDVSPGLLAALISRAVDEAAAIATSAGANERTLYGLGGYGDLLASMALPERPEVVLGRSLAGGASLANARTAAKLRIEAVELLPRITRFAQRQGVRCGIFKALTSIVDGSADPEDIVRALFVTRAARAR